jgi:hypothetical protein
MLSSLEWKGALNRMRKIVDGQTVLIQKIFNGQKVPMQKLSTVRKS